MTELTLFIIRSKTLHLDIESDILYMYVYTHAGIEKSIVDQIVLEL